VLAVGVGVALTEETTPLFHCNFLPTFTHVNFLPKEIEVCPTLLQVDPALAAEKLGWALRIEIPIDKQATTTKTFLGFNLILEG
jgi:hypothetical protein